eukprot:scaffold197094_cov19-Tisochrysis_lutea.AAC.1
MGNALNSIIRMHKKLPPIIQGYPALDLHAVGQHTVEHLTGDLVNLHSNSIEGLHLQSPASFGWKKPCWECMQQRKNFQRRSTSRGMHAPD